MFNEGHFTKEATWDTPRKFKQQGYVIHLIFFGLKNTGLSELRVVARAKEGGHYVDPVTIADNFYGNLEKLNQHFGLFHTVQIVDTSETKHEVIALVEKGIVISSIPPDQFPQWFVDYLPAIAGM